MSVQLPNPKHALEIATQPLQGRRANRPAEIDEGKRRVMTRIWILPSILLSLVLTMAAHPALAQGSISDLTLEAADVRLALSPTGRRESPVFSIKDKSFQVYVRDAGVPTARGPLDRVCIEQLNYQFISSSDTPAVALTSTSAGRDGRRPFRTSIYEPLGRRGNAPEMVCELLPAAETYRVWAMDQWVESSGLEPAALSPWRPPAVVSTLESMDQEDFEAVFRNWDRMLSSLDLDGVCVELAVWPAAFSVSIGTDRDVEPFQRGFDYVAAMSDYVYRATLEGNNDDIDEWVYISGHGWPQGLNNGKAYYLAATSAFGPREKIVDFVKETYVEGAAQIGLIDSTFPGFPVINQFDCFGEPIRHTVFEEKSLEATEIEAYGLLRVGIMIPYDVDNAHRSREEQTHWRRAFWHEEMAHELIHAYDAVDVFNETVFRIKASAQLAAELRALGPEGMTDYYKLRLPTFERFHTDGYWKGPWGLLKPYLDVAIQGYGEALKYFHSNVSALTDSGALPPAQ